MSIDKACIRLSAACAVCGDGGTLQELGLCLACHQRYDNRDNLSCGSCQDGHAEALGPSGHQGRCLTLLFSAFDILVCTYLKLRLRSLGCEQVPVMQQKGCVEAFSGNCWVSECPPPTILYLQNLVVSRCRFTFGSRYCVIITAVVALNSSCLVKIDNARRVCFRCKSVCYSSNKQRWAVLCRIVSCN